MSSPTKSIFLSAENREFRSYKDELAHALTRRGFLVKTRDDFHPGPDLLERLEEYIRQCDTMIALVGHHYGDEPEAAEAESFADISKGQHSLTQWEFLFGNHIGKSVHVFSPSEFAKLDQATDNNSEQAGLQDAFRQTWIESGSSKPVEFDDPSSLREEALVIKALTPKTEEPVIARKLELENPYVGLRMFTEKDAAKFYGRKTLVDKIITKVSKTPLLTVFGRSGSGKSSVVRAGVIPRFRKEYPNGKVVVFNPDENPFESFALGLSQAGLPDELAVQALDASSNIFREIRTAAGNPAEPWLIFVDQFEEIFTRAGKQNAPLVFQFVQSLIDITTAKNVAIRVVLAIRGDFMGRLSEYKELAEICDQNLVRVAPPSWQELCDIIEKPAANHGVRYETNLAARIASHVEGQPQRLPLLQYALERLWEVEKSDLEQFSEGMVVDDDVEKMGGLHDRKINRVSYNQIHGVEKALTSKLEEVYGDRKPNTMTQIRNLMLAFVQITDTDLGLTPVSRSVPLAELHKIGGVGSSAIINEMLAERILVKSDCSNGDYKVIELAHEALIHAWSDFKGWVDEICDAAQFKRALSADAKHWDSKKGKAAISHQDLWGGAKLLRAIEFNENAKPSMPSDFERVGGLTALENEFLVESGDQKVKEIKYRLSESAAEWKNAKSKDVLWAGSQLSHALELNTPKPGQDQSDFDRVGGLEKPEKKFLKTCEKKSHPKPTALNIALVTMACIAALGLFTPIGGAGMALVSGGGDTSSGETMMDMGGIKDFFMNLLPKKEAE